jgi:sugar/nucleoside kinase (ribokinase family)
MELSHKKTDVLVVGELNVDLIMDKLEAFPQLGKEVIANRLLLTLGSSSAIFASNLSVLGTRVSFCGRVGRDNFATKILADLTAKGVMAEYIIQSDSADTGVTVALNAEEDRAMVTYPGAMNDLTADDVTDEMLDSARHLHVSSVFLQPALKIGLVGLLQRARQKGLTTSLDPQWDPSENWEMDKENLLPLVNVFLPNIEELKKITHTSSLDEALTGIRDISDIAVVKNGNSGAVLQQKKTSLTQPAFINPNVMDAIGAGDSFNAGFIHLFIQGKPLAECLSFGALCGAINTTSSGGTSAFTDFETVSELAIQKFNVRL